MTDKRDLISRRDFASRSVLAAAAVAAGKVALGTARRGGAGDRGERPGRPRQHRHPRPGQRPQAGLRPAAERRDQDALRHRREPVRRAGSTTRAARTSPTFKPGYQQDLRRVLDDKDIDGVVIATPEPLARARHHLGAAGRQARLRREARVPHACGKAARWSRPPRKYGKIVQVGTMNRSRPAVRQAIKFIHDGGIGNVYMARGLCFKPRPGDRQVPGRADAARREVPAERGGSPRTSRPTTPRTWPRSTTTCGSGPRRQRPFNRNRFHYNWHWHWDYGNGDTGNQGPHQFDIARWGLGKNEHPVKVRSVGGYFGEPSSQETPTCRPRSTSTPTARSSSSATRGGYTNDEGTQRIGNLFYGTKGWVWIDGDGRKWQSYLGRKDEKGPGSDAPPEQGGSDPQRAHQHRDAALPELRRRDPRRRSRRCSPATSSKGISRRRSRTSPTSRTGSAARSSSTARPRRSSATPRPTAS